MPYRHFKSLVSVSTGALWLSTTVDNCLPKYKMNLLVLLYSVQPGLGPGLNFLTRPEPGKNPYPSHRSPNPD